MKRFVALWPALIFLFFCVSPVFSENSSDQVMIYRLKDGKTKEINDHFSTDERIYAEFTFLPEEKETGVEFRWINPVNKKVQVDFEIVKTPLPPKKQTVTYWMLHPSRLHHMIIGSKSLGRWRLEIWVNSRRVIEKTFDIGI
jgi:hypothetical protein